MLDFMLQELDQIRCNRPARIILRMIRLCLIRIVAFYNRNHLFRIYRDMRSSDTVLGRHDKIGLPIRREIRHGDVVQTFKRGPSGVHFDDDLVGHLDELGGGAYGGSGDNAAVFGDGACFHDGNVEAVVGLVERVESVHEIYREHAKVFIEEVYVSIIYSFGNLLTYLVRRTPLDHVQTRPSVLSLGAGGSADKEVVL